MCFAQGRLRLRAGGVDQLLQGRFGLAQTGALFIVAQLEQQVASLYRVTLTHMASCDDAGDFAADLGQRLAVHLTAGDHALYQWACLQAVTGECRSL